VEVLALGSLPRGEGAKTKRVLDRRSRAITNAGGST